jgi:segregation and condensation protein B
MLSIERKVNKKLSRAGIETLAIIAYHQPVTRAEIEEIRGVVISKGTLDLLLEIGWIKPAGRRETPGRPVTWATTSAFLEHFGLENTAALPGVEELRAAGLLDARAGISTLATQASADGRGVPPEDEDEQAAAEELRGELQPDEGAEGEGGGEAADDDYEAELLRKHGEPGEQQTHSSEAGVEREEPADEAAETEVEREEPAEAGAEAVEREEPSEDDEPDAEGDDDDDDDDDDDGGDDDDAEDVEDSLDDEDGGEAEDSDDGSSSEKKVAEPGE